MADGRNVHHNLNGERRFEHERADHSRIVAEHGGRGEHPYRYGGRDFGRRTYYHDGRVYDRYYGRYYYHGVYVNYYTPAYYYRPAFYGWAYNPGSLRSLTLGALSAILGMGIMATISRLILFIPSAAAWLTDYMISASLAAAYANAQAQAVAAASGPPPGAAPLTPEVKDLISQEVQRQIALANAEAQSAQTAVPDPVQQHSTDAQRQCPARFPGWTYARRCQLIRRRMRDQPGRCIATRWTTPARFSSSELAGSFC